MANLQSNCIIFIHINIINSYVSFDKYCTKIPQEIWSNHQKGKMVKIRVLTEEGQFLIFNLENGQLVLSMISRVQLHHFNLMAWPKTLLKINWTDSEFSVNWSKSQLYTEKSNFDFLVKIQCQRSQFIKTCQNMKSFHH